MKTKYTILFCAIITLFLFVGFSLAQDHNNAFNAANLFSYLPTPKKISGSIHIYLSSPADAEILITDPQGRKLGRDPITNTEYNEIPEGSYTQEVVPGTTEEENDTKTLKVMDILKKAHSHRAWAGIQDRVIFVKPNFLMNF